LIAVTTAIFTIGYIAVQGQLLAILSFLLGAGWLVLETNERQTAISFFFLMFLGLAVVGCLQEQPIPIMLLGLTTTLAAWDLSRFQTRIGNQAEGDARDALEKNHIQKLAVTLGIGFVIGLVPVFVTISINFVVIVCVVLLAMLVLRKSVLSLHAPSNASDQDATKVK
jgi:hypothetical protein